MKKVLFISLAVVLALSVSLIGCGDGGGAAIPLNNPGSFVQMTIGGLDSLDPAWGYDTASGEQVQYIYETLLFYDGEKTSEFVPVLATEWAWNISDLTWRFHIRDGVNFHEGGNLTPEDVEYSFERLMVQDRDAGPAPMVYEALLGKDGWTGNFSEVDAAVEVEGEWVVFTLNHGSWALPFLQILCGSWASIVDMEWCDAQGDWDGNEGTCAAYHNPAHGTTALHDKTNGTGPWELEEWDQGNQIKLLRNDDYWRAAAPFERVITKFNDEWTTRKLALLNGDADHVYVPLMYSGELEGIDDLTVYQGLSQIYLDALFFTFNISSDSSYIGSGLLDGDGIPTDFFTDLDVRKGFCYAFDYATHITDALVGEGEQRGSPIVEGLLGFNPDAAMYSYNLTLAETHLRAAWGGDVWANGFRFTIFYNTGNTVRKIGCEILAQSLALMNEKFEVSVQPAQWSPFMNNFIAHRLPIFMVGWAADFPDPDNFATAFMHSFGDIAWCQCYSNPTIDALVVAGRYEMDVGAREDIYDELGQLYYDNAIGIITAQPSGRRYFTKYIHDYCFNPMIPGDPGPLYYMSKS